MDTYLIDKFNEIGIHFKSISEPEFNTKSANSKFFLHIFSAVAEFERNLISERTKVGLVNVRNRKKLLGWPAGAKKGTIDKYQYVKNLYDNQNTPISEACEKAEMVKQPFIDLKKNC